MNRNRIVLVVAGMAATSLACTLSVPFPVSDIKVGPTEQSELTLEPVGAPGDTARLELGIGAGELILRPGQGGTLLAGTVTYNLADLEPEVTIDGTRVTVNQGDLQLDGIPDLRRGEVINRWDLELGGQPIDLQVTAGAYQADLELGGISLTGLQISDGAASVRLAFSAPNLASMDTLRYITGASDVRMQGLANANFSRMSFQGGAGSFDLEFGGDLRQDAEIRIEAGLSSVRIVVPAGVPARAEVQGELSEVVADGGWSGAGSSYVHPGEGPALTFIINSSLGSIRLETD